MKFNLKKVLTRGTALAAVLALVLVFWPKGASAADQIDSGDVKDQSLLSRDLAADSVGRSEIRPKAVSHVELSDGAWDYLQKGKGAFDQNKTQQTDINSLKTSNSGQDDKISDLEDRVEAEETEGDNYGLHEVRAGAGYTTFAEPGYSVAYNKCDVDGQTAISGGYRLNGHASEAFSGADQNAMPEGLTVVATEPAAAKGGQLVNSYQDPDFPQTEDGAFQPNAWAVTFHNTTDQPLAVRVWAVCATA